GAARCTTAERQRKDVVPQPRELYVGADPPAHSEQRVVADGDFGRVVHAHVEDDAVIIADTVGGAFDARILITEVNETELTTVWFLRHRRVGVHELGDG